MILNMTANLRRYVNFVSRVKSGLGTANILVFKYIVAKRATPPHPPSREAQFSTLLTKIHSHAKVLSSTRRIQIFDQNFYSGIGCGDI